MLGIELKRSCPGYKRNENEMIYPVNETFGQHEMRKVGIIY